MRTYAILLDNDTTATIRTKNNPNDLIGYSVFADSKDENGNRITVTGTLTEVLYEEI